MSGRDPDMRLSDAERQEAMDALSQHVRTGRLDLEEFGDRSARISAAKLRSDLRPLFADLPAPKPAVLGRDSSPVRGEAGQAPLRALAAGAVPLAAIIAVVLYFTVARGFLFVFVLPIAVALLIGSQRRR